jgi:hypothetical protein
MGGDGASRLGAHLLPTPPHGDAGTFDYWATTHPGADFQRASKASSRTHGPRFRGMTWVSSVISRPLLQDGVHSNYAGAATDLTRTGIDFAEGVLDKGSKCSTGMRSLVSG